MASHALPSDAALRSDMSQLLDALRRIVRHLRLAASDSETKVGVAPAQLFVLSRLAEGPAASIRELAERTMTDPSSVSVVLGKLSERGLVARTADPADRRRTQLSLTERGAAVLRNAPPLPQVHLLAAMGQLPALKRRAMVGVLHELVAALGAEGTKPELFFEDDAPKPAARSRAPGRPRATAAKARAASKTRAKGTKSRGPVARTRPRSSMQLREKKRNQIG